MTNPSLFKTNSNPLRTKGQTNPSRIEPIDLYPHQKTAVDWLSGRKVALLALEMGLGKTAIAIRAAEQIAARKILVLCPAVAIENWKREFERFGAADLAPEILSYGSLHQLRLRIMEHKLFETGKIWDVCILDEAHYLKSPDADRTQSVLAKGGILHFAERAWCLSGTPCPNHAGELWPMLFSFGFTALKYDKFIREFCDGHQVSVGRFKYPRFQIRGTKQDKIPELKKLLEPFMLHETKKSVGLCLPPISYEDVYIGEGFALKEDTVPKDFWAQLEKERDNFLDAVEEFGDINYTDDFCSLINSLPTLRRFTGLQKVRYASELLNTELNSRAYEKIVVFCIHRDVIKQIVDRTKTFCPVFIEGSQSGEQRQKAIDAFQSDPTVRLIVANITSAGIAINLTAANQILFVEQDWVPGTNAQAIMRCHRIGMKDVPLTVRYLKLAGNSIDDKITKTLKRKTEEIIALFAKTPSVE